MNTTSIQDGTEVTPHSPADTLTAEPSARKASFDPIDQPLLALEGRPFHDSWHLTLVDPASHRALYLKHSLLATGNGFRKIAEVSGAFSERISSREVFKHALRQTFDLAQYRRLAGEPGSPAARDSFRIGFTELSENRAVGSIRSKGKTLDWDLSLTPRHPSPALELIPAALKKAGLFSQSLLTHLPELSATGTVTVNGTSFAFTEAPGMMSHESGNRSPHSGIRAQCNFFRNERGAPVRFVFQGLSFRGHLFGAIPSPRFTSLHFFYEGRKFQFNSIRDAIQLKSRVGLNDWHFQAEEGDLTFRGHARFDHRDFAGFSHEDTTGSLIYSAHSMLSDLEIQIIRRGRLEAGLRADQCASIELLDREKSLYVPLMA